MSYEDLEKAKAERAAKEAVKEVRKAEKEVKKADKEVKKAAKEAEVAIAGKTKRGRKRKSPADAPEPQAKVARMSEASEPVGFQMSWMSEEQQVALVARMI